MAVDINDRDIFGASFEKLREMLPKFSYTKYIRPKLGVKYTPEEMAAFYPELKLPEGWSFTGEFIARDPSLGGLSPWLRSPEGAMYSFDDIYLTPEGGWTTTPQETKVQDPEYVKYRQMFSTVFPFMSDEEVFNLAISDFATFEKTIKAYGKTAETEGILRALYGENYELALAQFFGEGGEGEAAGVTPLKPQYDPELGKMVTIDPVTGEKTVYDPTKQPGYVPPGTVTKEYATDEQFAILVQAKEEGTLAQKQMTRSLWLTNAQARELGYPVVGDEDYELTPEEGLAITAPPPTPQTELENLLTELYPEAVRALPAEDEALLFDEYQRTGGKYDLETWRLAGSPLRPDDEFSYLSDLVDRATLEEATSILTRLGATEEDIDAILGEQRQAKLEGLVRQTFKGMSLDDFTFLVENDWETFNNYLQAGDSRRDKLELLQIMGLSPDLIDQLLPSTLTKLRALPIQTDAETRRILKQGGVSDTEIGKIISLNKLKLDSEGWLEKWKGINPSVKKDVAYSLVSRSFAAGLGDIVASGAGVAGWGKQNTLQENLLDIASVLQSSAPPDESWDVSFGTIVDPRFWQTVVTRALPFTLAIVPMAVVTASGGAAVAGAAGLGSFGTLVLTSLFGAVGAAAGEGVLEAGGTYNEAKAKGWTDEEASQAAQSVFVKNIGMLTGTNAVEFFAAFLPAPARTINNLITRGLVRTVTVAGRVTITGLSESGQEMIQEAFQRQAMGEKVEWTDEMKMAGMLGGIMGVTLGGAGDVFTSIQSRVKTKLTPEQRASFIVDVSNFKAQGLTQEQAELRALDNVADTKEGKTLIEEVVGQVEKEENITRVIAGIDPSNKTELLAWRRILAKSRAVLAEERGAIGRPERITKAVWDAMPVEQRVQQATQAGLSGQVGSKAFEALTAAERTALGKVAPSVTPEVTIPKAEPVPAVEITTPTGEKIPSTITEAPSPTEGATARVFSRIQTEYAEAGFREKARQGWHQFNIKMVDDLDPIRRITEEIKKGGVELSIDENPYLLARLLRGVTSKATTFLEYGTFGKNFWKVDAQGRATPNYTGESLQNILNEVKDPVVWRDFSTYLTARRAVELSERNIETGIEVEDAKASITELEERYASFPDLAQRVYKYQGELLAYAQEMGLISKELLVKLRKFGNYVPFYRVFNELQAKGLFGSKMANVANPIKRIKGSERQIINPLESIVKNTYVLVSAADRNQVGIAIANLVDKNPDMADVFERVRTPIARVAQVSAKELGLDIEGMTETDGEQLVDIFRPSFFVRGDEVTVLIDGKKHYYRVDPELRDSLLRLDRESLGLLGKWLGAPARWLRAGATLSPDFMFRNPARDQLSAFAYSNYGFLPGIDFIKGIASMLRKDSDYQLFRMSGAEHSMIVSMDRSYLRKTFKQLVGEEGFTEYVKHPLELFRIISEMGEKGTRLGEFKKGIKAGAVPLEAGYSARSVTLDFAQAGTTAQAINTFIAFFNANIRGWAKMMSSFKEHPIRTSAKVFMGITLPSILLWMANHDDDRWKEIPQWQKDLFWIVFVGDNIYRIPKPFELGIIFGSFPERFLDFLVEKDPDLMKNLGIALMEAGSPGFLPTAGLPILEWMTNYSFFRGRAIIPESRKDLPPELQYTRWTSEVSKKLGELLKLPPAQIDNLMFAWTGGLGRYATDIMDVILKKTGISSDIPEPSPTLVDMPVIKAFVVRSPYGSSSEAVNDFYNLLEEYEGGEKYLKEMLIAGETEKYNKFKAAHSELFFFADFESERYAEAIAKGETPKDVFYSSSARYLRRVARQLSEIRKKEDLIYKDPDMSSEKKRQLIDELEILKTEIARKAVDLLQMKDPTILQDMINETVNRLGEVIEEGTPLSLEAPDIHDMGKLNQDFKSILEGATVEELQKLEGVNPLAIAWIEKEGIEKTIEPIINKQIKDIDFKLREGVTFEDYYRNWQAGLVKDSPLEKLSKRQIELLRGYLASEDKQAYLKTLSEDDREALSLNPQKEWLKTHPKENAQLAVWGQAKLLTKEAYDEFKRLVKELDIPGSALPEMTLPPEGSISNYFKYQALENKNSWEAQLMLAKDDDLRKFLGRQPIDTPIASLELKIKNREHYDAYDALTTDKERKQYKLDNSGWVDDIRRIEAIEKGTNEAPIDVKLVNAHVGYGKLVDQEGVGSSSAEVMLYRVDNPEYDEWWTDTAIWGDQALKPIDSMKIPIWRIDVKYAKEDAEYDALPATGTARRDYLAANEDYRKDRRRREAYQKGLTAYVEDYVSYYELPTVGYRQERFLFNNPDFARALGLKVPDRVVSEEYDNLLEKTDRTEEDTLRMVAYKLYVPDQFIDDYVAYKAVQGKGYEDDWWMMEHPEFYKQVYLGILGNKRKDYRKVPTRDVYAKYLIYRDISTDLEQRRYRLANLDLDEWGQLVFGWTSIKEWKPAPEPTPKPEAPPKKASSKKKGEDDFDEKLRKLRELLGAR